MVFDLLMGMPLGVSDARCIRGTRDSRMSYARQNTIDDRIRSTTYSSFVNGTFDFFGLACVAEFEHVQGVLKRESHGLRCTVRFSSFGAVARASTRLLRGLFGKVHGSGPGRLEAIGQLSWACKGLVCGRVESLGLRFER